MQEEKLKQVEGEDEVVEEEEDESEGKIVADKTKANVLDVSPGCLAIELPAGYIHEGELYTTAVVREMRGHEEDLLAAKGSIVVRLNAIIGNCLVQLGSIGDKSILRRAATSLTAQDRMAVILAIRRASLGDFYDCTVTCPECKTVQHVNLNLSEIEIIPMPDRMRRERVDTLPSGTEVKWHVIRTQDEEWLTAQKKKKQDTLTLGLLARVEAVGEVVLDRERAYRKAISALKDLSIRDRTALRNLFDKEEGSIDTKVEFECEDCGHEWEGNLDVGQPNFFFPSDK